MCECVGGVGGVEKGDGLCHVELGFEGFAEKVKKKRLSMQFIYIPVYHGFIQM